MWTGLFQVSIGFIPSFFFFFFFRTRGAKESLWNGVHSTLSISRYIGIKNFFGKLSFTILPRRGIITYFIKFSFFLCAIDATVINVSHTLIKVSHLYTVAISINDHWPPRFWSIKAASRTGKYLHLSLCWLRFYIYSTIHDTRIHVKNIFDILYFSAIIRRPIK